MAIFNSYVKLPEGIYMYPLKNRMWSAMLSIIPPKRANHELILMELPRFQPPNRQQHNDSAAPHQQIIFPCLNSNFDGQICILAG